LREEVKSGRFREDLMYRLRVVPIFLPPLRERREDISLLIWHFIEQHNEQNQRKIDKIEPEAMRLLLDYSIIHGMEM
jgi:transcriptional regulator with GAF, ATPase, and Fis domain